MRSDNAALSTVQDALGLGSATVDTAYTAMNSAIDVVSAIKRSSSLLASQALTVRRCKARSRSCRTSLPASVAQRHSAVKTGFPSTSSATGYNATKSIVSSFTRSGGSVSIGTISVDTSNIKLFDASAAADGILDGSRDATGAISSSGTFSLATLDISSLTDSAADQTTLDSFIKGADAAFGEVTNAAASLGAVKSRIDLQKDFVSNLMTAIEKGVGPLVDADMNQELTKLQALQVQAQLGVQALSIANQSSQNILSLFRG